MPSDAGVPDAALADCHALQGTVPTHCVVITEGQAKACYVCTQVERQYETAHPVETSNMFVGAVLLLGMLIGWASNRWL